MKNIGYLFVLLVAMFATGAQADTVGSMTTFSAGSPAVAGEVNGNFNAVATAVNGNDTLIGDNATAITNLSGSINGNTIGIASNANAIGAIDTSGIATNANNIINNASGIATNANNIINNATGVFNNGVAIGAIDTSGIATNASDIVDLNTAIAGVTTPQQWTIIDDNGSVNSVDVGVLVSSLTTVSSGVVSYMSDQGYIRPSVRIDNGQSDSYQLLWYTSSCSQTTSAPYSSIGGNYVFDVKQPVGAPVRYYTNATVTVSTVLSVRQPSGTCVDFVQTGTFWVASINSGITGIPNANPVPPLKVVFK